LAKDIKGDYQGPYGSSLGYFGLFLIVQFSGRSTYIHKDDVLNKEAFAEAFHVFSLGSQSETNKVTKLRYSTLQLFLDQLSSSYYD